MEQGSYEAPYIIQNFQEGKVSKKIKRYDLFPEFLKNDLPFTQKKKEKDIYKMNKIVWSLTTFRHRKYKMQTAKI